MQLRVALYRMLGAGIVRPPRPNLSDGVDGEVATRGVDTISSTEPDWSREATPLLSWRPAQSLISSLRSYERWQKYRNPVAWAMRALAAVRHLFWSVVTGAEIPLGTKIGGGLLILHPNGIVIHPGVVIGPNCLIFQQVTLGSGNGGVPRIGGHVDIGAGAKILGAITVGDHAKIGANAVVLRDVPANTTAVGIPARIVASL
jgi:serine O-acetyltransferase